MFINDRHLESAAIGYMVESRQFRLIPEAHFADQDLRRVYVELRNQHAETGTIEPAAVPGADQWALAETGDISIPSEWEPIQRALSDAYIKRQCGQIMTRIVQNPEAGAVDYQQAVSKMQSLIEDGRPADRQLWSDSDIFIPKWDNEPAEIPAVLSMGESKLLTAGNLCGIIAAAGTGKSAICEVLTVARLNPNVDTFGLKVGTEKLVGYLDTERTSRDHWRSWARAMRRAGVVTGSGADGVTFELIGMIPDVGARKDRLKRLVESERFGLLIVDGLADFVLDVNDPKECNPFLNELFACCKKHETAILTTIHSNPQRDAEKARGHLGSELMRRAESVLMIKHDRATGIRSLTMNFSHGKNRNDADNLECHFAWNYEAEMFLSCDAPPIKKGKMAAEIDNILEAIGDQKEWAYSDLRKKITNLTGKTERTAEARIKAMIDSGDLLQNPNKTYSAKKNELADQYWQK